MSDLRRWCWQNRVFIAEWWTMKACLYGIFANASAKRGWPAGVNCCGASVAIAAVASLPVAFAVWRR
jgi:hypothetical protein